MNYSLAAALEPCLYHVLYMSSLAHRIPYYMSLLNAYGLRRTLLPFGTTFPL